MCLITGSSTSTTLQRFRQLAYLVSSFSVTLRGVLLGIMQLEHLCLQQLGSSASLGQLQQSQCWMLQQPSSVIVLPYICTYQDRVQQQCVQHSQHSKQEVCRPLGVAGVQWVYSAQRLLEGGTIKHRWLRKAAGIDRCLLHL